MGDYQQLFKRYEKKYTLNQAQYELIKQAIAQHMVLDDHGRHLIQNIYYDTSHYDLIRQSIDKPLYKEKLRLRCYGAAVADSSVYLEIKKKFKGIVYKRRIQLPNAIASSYAEGRIDIHQVTSCLDPEHLAESLQVLQEIDWMLKRYQLKPKVYIAYHREAYQCLNGSDFRITFDSGLNYRTQDLTLGENSFYSTSNQPIADDGLWLMEVKSSSNLPLWFVNLLSEYCIYPASYSKYGQCYKSHLAPYFIHSLAASRPTLLKAFEQPSLIPGGQLYA